MTGAAVLIEPNVPPRLKAHVQRHVDRLRPLMGLTDWQITIVDWPTIQMLKEMSGTEYHAWISPTSGARHALLWLSDDFYADTFAGQRETLVHELLHCHHFPEEELVMQALRQLLGVERHDVIRLWWTQDNEYAIDAIATAWAPMLPPFTYPKSLLPALRRMGWEDEETA